MFTLHLLLAKFFLICRLTDSWMFLQSAVSPAILTHTNRHIYQHVLFQKRNWQLLCSILSACVRHSECCSLSPGVSERQFAGEALGRILFHQTANEILGWQKKGEEKNIFKKPQISVCLDKELYDMTDLYILDIYRKMWQIRCTCNTIFLSASNM